MMKNLCLLMLLCTGFSQAADVPVMNQPTVNQRMRVAREAIAKSDWHVAKYATERVIAGDFEPGLLFPYSFILIQGLSAGCSQPGMLMA